MPIAEGQRVVLETLARSSTAEHRDVLRAKALLLAADGVANTRIGADLGVSATTVSNWRERFASDGLKGIGVVRRGRGRKPSIAPEKAQAIVHATLHEKPPGETHWSCRSMAKAQGVSPATVQRIWSARDLRLVDVAGLYLNPPENAIVVAMDGKSQIQALDGPPASLPIKPGRAATMTHDYPRNGTTTLFAALDVLTGSGIGPCLPRHHPSELLTFLATIDGAVPKGLEIHLILDDAATHTPESVQQWLAQHSRFHLHLTPPSSSWCNLVERFFGRLTGTAIRRGGFHSVPDLITAIEAYLQANDENPKPFVWTQTAERILEKARRGGP